MHSINCSDLKSMSYEVVRRNFSNLTHFFDSLEGQIDGAGCYIHPGLDAVDCNYEMGPELFVLGTPCQPFSKQRTKRHHPNSVVEHPRYDVTFTDTVNWLQHFEPKSGCMENVLGFDCAEDWSAAPEKDSPMGQFLGLGPLVSCVFFLLGGNIRF